MLSLHQSDGLGQRCPLTPDQPHVEFIQQSLLRSTQLLYLLPGGCAHTPPALQAAEGTDEEPSVWAPSPANWAAEGREVTEEGEAESPHFTVNVG